MHDTMNFTAPHNMCVLCIIQSKATTHASTVHHSAQLSKHRWQWRHFVPYLRQSIFAAILQVKLWEMFVAVTALKYASLVTPMEKWTLSWIRLITRSEGSCRTGFTHARLPVLTKLKQSISDEWDENTPRLISSWSTVPWNSGVNVLQPVFLHEADT